MSGAFTLRRWVKERRHPLADLGNLIQSVVALALSDEGLRDTARLAL